MWPRTTSNWLNHLAAGGQKIRVFKQVLISPKQTGKHNEQKLYNWKTPQTNPNKTTSWPFWNQGYKQRQRGDLYISIFNVLLIDIHYETRKWWQCDNLIIWFCPKQMDTRQWLHCKVSPSYWLNVLSLSSLLPVLFSSLCLHFYYMNCSDNDDEWWWNW